MTHPTPKTMGTKELATRLGVHEKTVRRQCLAGQIPVHCYSKTGAHASYRFFTLAAEYLCEHGTWPSQAEMARYGRYGRAARASGSDMTTVLTSSHIDELDALLLEIDDPKVLHEALAAELGRRNRKGALAALRRRLREVEGAADVAA